MQPMTATRVAKRNEFVLFHISILLIGAATFIFVVLYWLILRAHAFYLSILRFRRGKKVIRSFYMNNLLILFWAICTEKKLSSYFFDWFTSLVSWFMHRFFAMQLNFIFSKELFLKFSNCIHKFHFCLNACFSLCKIKLAVNFKWIFFIWF